MKIRGVILATCAMMVFFASYACANQPEPEPVSSAKPVMVPYINRSINEVKNGYAGTPDASVNADSERTRSTEEAAGEDSNEAGTGFGAVLTNAGRMEKGEDEPLPELVESEPNESAGRAEDPLLTYLGTYTSTAYCSCVSCTTDGNGYTASGTIATEGRTVACNCLPIGTEVMIEGHTYFVEDTGWTPYGEAWIDIYFESHEAALAYGVREVEVYMVN